MDKITRKILDDAAPIKPAFQKIVRESLDNLNMEDKSYFDHAQYQDAKATEKNLASKYYLKESNFISQIVNSLHFAFFSNHFLFLLITFALSPSNIITCRTRLSRRDVRSCILYTPLEAAARRCLKSKAKAKKISSFCMKRRVKCCVLESIEW